MPFLPSITIITGTLNSHIPTFREVLESVLKQKYPKNLIEHIVMDKGSTNGCAELALKYGCKVDIRKYQQGEEQLSAGFGILKAHGELILILESDNILTSKDWLSEMVKPFIKEERAFCTFSAYNSYKSNMSLMTRYCALFGSPEPTLYYLKKTEKVRLDQKRYDKGEILKETPDYFIVRFNQENLPTLGDNGHMFKRKVMLKVLKKPEDYLHVDAFAQLLGYGYDTFGVVKNSVIHTMNPDILRLVRRRVEVKQDFYDAKRGRRKYLVFNPRSKKDRVNLAKFIIFSLTFLEPLFESFQGYIRVRDKAWFLHPIFCFLMVVGYGQSEVRFLLRRFSLRRLF